MKVLLLNGSPHAKGCTYTALAEAAGALEAAGVETEFVHIGTKAIRGCIGCGKCREAKRCVFDDDPVNEAIEKARACDGFIFGSPVYYASPNGAALDALNKYFTINCMPVVSSKYWNMVHGNTPDEVRHDLEGMQVMRTLGRNMAWLLKCIEIGRASGITAPEPEPPVRTNFIR